MNATKVNATKMSIDMMIGVNEPASIWGKEALRLFEMKIDTRKR